MNRTTQKRIESYRSEQQQQTPLNVSRDRSRFVLLSLMMARKPKKTKKAKTRTVEEERHKTTIWSTSGRESEHVNSSSSLFTPHLSFVVALVSALNTKESGTYLNFFSLVSSAFSGGFVWLLALFFFLSKVLSFYFSGGVCAFCCCLWLLLI